MSKLIGPALFVALLCGLAIGVQASLNSAAGKTTGAILTGLLVNLVGGIAAGLLIIVLSVRQGPAELMAIQRPTIGIMVLSGILGVGIIVGLAYSLPLIGVAAGLSALIAGQMLVALIVDTFGLAGGPPIPLSLARLGGLGLLALGTWALLPHR